MALPLNRTAIALDLAAFFGVSLFCISTQAPIIQQDISKRCQDALSANRIPIQGLSVDGRDVKLAGPAGSAIVSARAYTLLSEVSGVRVVQTHALSSRQHSASNAQSGGTAAETDSLAISANLQHDIQEKIDRVLDNHGIAFKPDTTTLTPESEAALNQIASYLTAGPGLFCEIRGFDTQPGELHQNWVMALQRALAAEDFLEMKGIADWRLSTRAFHMGEGTDGRRSDRPVDLVVRTRE